MQYLCPRCHRAACTCRNLNNILLRAATWLYGVTIAGQVVLLGLMLASSAAHAQSSPKKYLSAASTNSNLVQTGKSSLRAGVVVNTTATVYYLKLYDKSTSPTCGTDVPKWTVPLTANAVTPLPVSDGLQFYLGLGFCITAGIADNDVANAAVGVAVNLGVTGQ